jgi:hypothetical protein
VAATVVATVATPDTTAVALFEPSGFNMASALLAVTETPEPTVGGPAFPILTTQGGNAGGAFVPLKGMPQEIADLLPQGRKPVEGVFLAYRTELTAWPVGYSDAPTAQGDEKSKPVWDVAAPCSDAALTQLVQTACRKYQYTKGADKHIWNFEANGVGHIRPVLQLMIYLPTVDDVIVVQTASHYASWRRSLDNLARNVDPATKQLMQFPCSIRSVSAREQVGPNEVSIHTFDIQAVMNDSGKKWWEAYAAWRTRLANAPDVVALVKEWMAGSDKPATAQIRERLSKGAAMPGR